MRFWTFALILLAGLGGAARGQQAPAPGGTTIVKNVNTVALTFVALDKKGHFVPGLTAQQIQIFDNGIQQKIQRFDAQGGLPLRIVLLLDISNSIRDRWAFEQRAATDFLQSVLVPGRDQAMVVGFDTTPHIVQGFSGSYTLLAAAIRNLNPGGGTALYDALFTVSHNQLGPASGAPGEVRNVIVLISDGADDQSRYSRDEALGMAQDAGAVIYTIGTEPTGLDPTYDKVLQRFAEQTGGRAFFPIQARDLGTAFASIVTDLRHQYVVSYNPNDFVPNGAFHPVEIKILRNNVIARTRKGYFAR